MLAGARKTGLPIANDWHSQRHLALPIRIIRFDGDEVAVAPQRYVSWRIASVYISEMRPSHATFGLCPVIGNDEFGKQPFSYFRLPAKLMAYENLDRDLHALRGRRWGTWLLLYDYRMQ